MPLTPEDAAIRARFDVDTVIAMMRGDMADADYVCYSIPGFGNCRRQATWRIEDIHRLRLEGRPNAIY